MLTTQKRRTHLLPERAEQILMEWANLGDGVGVDKLSERIKGATWLMLAFSETFQLSRQARAELLRLDGIEEPTDEQLDQLDLLDARLLLVEQIRELLRRVWQSNSQRDREWLIFVIRAIHDRFLHSSGSADSKDTFIGTFRIETDPATGKPAMYQEKSFDPLTSRRMHRQQRLKNYLRRQSQLPEVELTFDLAADVHAPEMNTFELVLHYFQRNEDRALRCANPECPAPFFFSTRQGQRYCGTDCSGKAKREQNREWARRSRNAAKKQSLKRRAE
ncbi:MAG TPA: hypothetical protein VMG82_32190 [Candidatus Sulfotelmatobacter sp.]|nr:hypothetical protein [Candidatus Sulfotelmatobacter sp.]